MSSLTLWGRRTSFNVQKVLWVLDILKLSYSHIEVGGRFGGLATSEFKALNLHQKIPVLRDDELVVWESHTIIRYLAAKYSPSDLWRETPEERSYIDRWIDWTATKLQPDFMDLFWNYYRKPEQERDRATIQQAREKCAHDYSLLDKYLDSKSFLHGNSLTLADIPAGATLYRYLNMGLDVPRPANLMAWYNKMCNMEGYRRQIMTPYDELFGRSIF
jgi:glutathione S-transferase